MLRLRYFKNIEEEYKSKSLFSWKLLKSVTTLCGWGLPSPGVDQFLGGEFCLGGIAPLWVWAGWPKTDLSPQAGPIHRGWSLTSKNLHENVNYNFHSTSMFFKYFGPEIIYVVSIWTFLYDLLPHFLPGLKSSLSSACKYGHEIIWLLLFLCSWNPT